MPLPISLKTKMTADEIAEIFPHLKNYQITSPADYRYNCIAWAAGDANNWWQPSGAPYFFWPGTAAGDSLENCVKTFYLLGYQEETDAVCEPGFEKVALYADADGLLPTPPGNRKTVSGQANWAKPKTLNTTRPKRSKARLTAMSKSF